MNKDLTIVALVLMCWIPLGACSGPERSPNEALDTFSADVTVDSLGNTENGDTQVSGPWDSGSLADSAPAGDSNVVPPQDTGTTPPSDAATFNDAATLKDASDPADTTGPVDAGSTVDTAVPVGMAPSGSWLMVATPAIQNICGYDQEFVPQILVLTVGDDNKATATLEPPELFITLEFDGTLTGDQLSMQAEFTEAGPPSIGWATEHTHTINVTFNSKTSFDGSYVHEMVPNNAEPCTYNWTITAHKQLP